jgi:hypothetical protein
VRLRRHANHARRQLSKKGCYLIAPQLPAQDDFASRIEPVNLQDADKASSIPIAQSEDPGGQFTRVDFPSGRKVEAKS